MNFKKLSMFFVLTVLSMSVFPAVFAHETDDEAHETEHELEEEIREKSNSIETRSKVRVKDGELEVEFRERIKNKREEFREKRELRLDLLRRAVENRDRTKKDFKEARDKLGEIRLKIKDCEEADTQECIELRARAKGHMTKLLANSADQILALLERTKERVLASDLSEEEKQEIIQSLDEKIIDLAGARDIVGDLEESAEDSITKEEIKEAASIIKESWKEARVEIRTHAGNLASRKIGNVIHKSGSLQKKLDKILERLQKSGVDTSGLEGLINNFKAKIAEAKALHEEANELFKQARSSTGRKDELMKQATSKLREAHGKLKEAKGIIKEILQTIKQTDEGQKELDDEDDEDEGEDESGEEISEDVGEGQLEMHITDKPAGINITALEITISKIEVHRAGMGEFTPPTPEPECNDGLDNDNDTFIDFPDDPECANEEDNDESTLDLSGPEKFEVDGDTVALYHNEEGACDLTDETANDNDGILQPDCPNNSPARGPGMQDFGDALSFDGTDDHITVPDDDGLDITDEITMEAWLKPANVAAQNSFARAVIKGVDGISGISYGIAFDSNGEKIRGLISTNNGAITEVIATKDLTNDWHYIAVTYDGSKLKLYIDGEFDNEADVNGLIDINDLDLFFGGTTSDYFYNGELDEMRISDTARSAEEIKESFEGSPVPAPGPDTPAPQGCKAGWETVVTGPLTFDLIQLIDATALLGNTTLPACKYTQIRLHLDDAELFVGGEEQDLKVPSGRIKLIKPFTITEGQTTVLTLDFDAQKSVHRTGKKGYIMKPTIKVIQG